MAKSLAHTKFVCKYHIVFTPKYRHKIIYYELWEAIRQIMKDLSKWNEVMSIEGHLVLKRFVQVYFGKWLLLKVLNKISRLERDEF